jgi:hypothetical protein
MRKVILFFPGNFAWREAAWENMSWKGLFLSRQSRIFYRVHNIKKQIVHIFSENTLEFCC